MSEALQASAYVNRLMHEIEQIETRIKELSQEKIALQRQLIKANWESDTLKGVSRKNSVNRIMVEHRILDALRESKEPLGNDTLFDAAKRANFYIKPTTFRTYIIRMKDKGLIRSSGTRGYWELVS